MKRKTDAEELNDSSSKKFLKIIEVRSLANNENGFLGNGEVNNEKTKEGKPCKLFIEINKISHQSNRPCPKSKKKVQLKHILNFRLHETENNSSEKSPTKKKSMKCMACPKEFTDIPKLFKHLKTHMTCNICKLIYNSRKDYEEHYRLHKSDLEKFPHKCHICDSTFATLIELRHHASTKKHNYHLKNNLYFEKKKQQLIKNIPVVNLKNLIVANLKPMIFNCQVCLQTFTTVDEIDKHAKTHLQKLES